MKNKKLLEITEKHSEDAIKLILSYENFEIDVTKEKIEEYLYIAILFIGICLNKIGSNLTNNKDLCTGFRHIYNTIKHSKNPFELNYLNYNKSSLTDIAIADQARVEMNAAVEWEDIPKGKYENQYEKFKKCLFGKEVVQSIKDILAILKDEFN